ncbi:roadblock/LC7 domain-containing protein [Deinococcus taklimakanensis]|uniref:Roadblock/LC7 domain-containing protein n=1 Tax=Deinococcus taklimakanensis TaxID=536443 RepID=A0ABW5P458_9DEIO
MKLAALRQLPGVIASALVGPDGLPLEAHGEGSEVLAAELAALRSCTERANRRLGAGDISRLAFTSERIEVVAVTSGPFILGAAMLRGSDTRTTQQTLARLALELRDLPVSPEPGA